MHHSKFSCVLLCALLLLAGCSSSSGPEGPPPPNTSQIGGVLLIDGEPPPLGLIEMKLYPKGRAPKPGERIPKCIVGQDGRYTFSSYRDGDGAEPGEYVLSIEHLKMGGPGELYGPDKFGNNFNSPFNEDPRFQVTVVEGESGEVPTIDIKTSELEMRPSHPYASPPGKRTRRK